MTINPHDFRYCLWSHWFSIRRFSLASMLLLAFTVGAPAQTAAPSPSEGIQKHWNEFGVWGGMSFDSTTLIGKTPDARFGNIGLRYGRVLKTSKTVAFEWTKAPPQDLWTWVNLGMWGSIVVRCYEAAVH